MDSRLHGGSSSTTIRLKMYPRNPIKNNRAHANREILLRQQDGEMVWICDDVLEYRRHAGRALDGHCPLLSRNEPGDPCDDLWPDAACTYQCRHLCLCR